MRRLLILGGMQLVWLLVVILIAAEFGYTDFEALYSDRRPVSESDDSIWILILLMFFVSGPRWIAGFFEGPKITKTIADNPEMTRAEIRAKLRDEQPKHRLWVDRVIEFALFACVPQAFFFLTERRLAGSVIEFATDAIPIAGLYLVVIAPFYIVDHLWKEEKSDGV